ncbi:MAG TPA: ROK family protein [Methylophilaceae bacterium]|nr:ROK family protein [Methylophilaceae bacterium]
MAQLIGIDIGGTNLRVGVVEDGRIVHEQRSHADFSGICRTHAPATAWQIIIETLAAALRPVLDSYLQVASVGIGFPGFIDPVSGNIAQSPNLPGLRDVDLARDLAQALGRPVIVENDALAAAYGEFRLIEPQSGNLVYIGLGTGVGGGLIVAGQPYAGQHGVAMEIGHIIVETEGRPCGCGNRGCLEQYASASAVSLSYRESTDRDLDAQAIATLAHGGDLDALQAYAEAGARLGQVVAHLAKTLDVGDIIIGGGMSAAWSLMQTAFDERLQRDLIPVLRGRLAVRVSASGDQAGIIGAALLGGTRSGI